MVSEALKQFMEQNAGLFSNHHAVEFSSGYENSITVACNWPGEHEQAEYCLELLYEAQNFEQFIEAFQIRRISDLHAIQPQQLLDLFNNQKACINCMINDAKSYSLLFQKCGTYIQATADPGGKVHQVLGDLNGPTAYKIYTFTYFGASSN